MHRAMTSARMHSPLSSRILGASEAVLCWHSRRDVVRRLADGQGFGRSRKDTGMAYAE